MQLERAKFQNKLSQVQLYSLVNIIMVKIKIEPGIRYFNLLITEELNNYDDPMISGAWGLSDLHFKSV